MNISNPDLFDELQTMFNCLPDIISCKSSSHQKLKTEPIAKVCSSLTQTLEPSAYQVFNF